MLVSVSETTKRAVSRWDSVILAFQWSLIQQKIAGLNMFFSIVLSLKTQCTYRNTIYEKEDYQDQQEDHQPFYNSPLAVFPDDKT